MTKIMCKLIFQFDFEFGIKNFELSIVQLRFCLCILNYEFWNLNLDSVDSQFWILNLSFQFLILNLSFKLWIMNYKW